jgi:hypothetical protein
MNQPTNYTLLPYQVRLDSRLCPFARLLYGEIVALSQQTGYCWASNTFFAQLYQVREKSVSRWLRELRQNGYIRVEVAKGNQRKIYPSDLPKAAAQNESSDAPIAGGTPALSKGVADLREGVGSPLGEAEAALLLSNKNNNITEYIQGTPPFWEMDNKEDGVPRKVVLHSPPWTRPIPPIAAAPLPPAKNNAPPPFVKPSVKEAEDYMLSQKELCPNTLTARAQALRFVNYYESNGWKVGRNAMQDWQAAANNWLLNAKIYDQTSQRSHSSNRLHSPGNGRIDYSIPL